ncbi:MAG: ATP-binding protein [Candidatus Thermoplasmatota archaeon]|nr:ATP-binding protein [Candidatus Thermoplasmatota archaeon]
MSNNAKKVLFISREQELLQHVEDNLLIDFDIKIDLKTSDDFKNAFEELNDQNLDMIIFGMGRDTNSSMEDLDRVMMLRPEVPVILSLDRSNLYIADEAMKKGVKDYFIPAEGRDEKLQTITRYTLEIRSLHRHIEDFKNKMEKLESLARDLTDTKNDHEPAGPAMTGWDYARMLSSGITMDMNKELILISSFIEDIRKNRNDPKRIEINLRKMKGSIRSLEVIMDNLQFFSGEFDPRYSEVDLQKIVDETIENMGLDDMKRIELKVTHTEKRHLTRGDGELISKVLRNILRNSLEAIRGNGRISVHLEERHPENGENEKQTRYNSIRIIDDGCGIPSDRIGQVFKPFYTTKMSGASPGLGLSVSYGIMKKIGGKVLISSREGKGTKITLLFPSRTAVRSTTASKETTPTNLRGQGERILLIVEKRTISAMISKILAENGYVVFISKDPAQAKKLFMMEKGNFDLVMIDLFLEQIPTMDLVDTLYRINDGVPVKFIVTRSNRPTPHVIARSSFSYIREPIDPYKLIESVKETFHTPTMEKKMKREMYDDLFNDA